MSMAAALGYLALVALVGWVDNKWGGGMRIDAIDMVDLPTDDRLQNWAFCLRYGLIRGHCGSIEHMYRSPDVFFDDERAPYRDHADAWRIEGMLCDPAFPEKPRRLLVLHYVRRADQGVICRRLAIPYRLYTHYWRDAVLMAKNRLAFLDNQTKV